MTLRATAESPEVADLYRMHFDYVWQVLQKLGVDTSSLEDAAHDVFMVAHRRWGEFEGRSAARTWLFSVARRVADRHRRSAFRRRRRRSALALAPAAEPIGPDVQLQRTEAWQLLLDFLDGLEPAHREAFVLGEIEGLSRTKMGAVLGISPNTAYSRLRAARSHFSEAFPVSARRGQVRDASSPPSEQAKRRGWLLLAAQLGAKTSLLVPATSVAASLVVATVVGVFVRSPTAVEGTTTVLPEPTVVAMASEGPARPRARRERPVSVSSTVEPEPIEAPPMQPPSQRAAAPRSRVADDERRMVSGLGPSMDALTQARRALKHGQPLRAVSLLDQSQRRDPEGAFTTERAVTRVLALCAASRVHQAREALSPLRSSGGLSAYARVLGDSCVADAISSATAGDQGG